VSLFQDGWTQWNPFDDEDKTFRYTYAGPKDGVGATTSWDSDSSGDGHMTITRADPKSGVDYDLALMHDSYRLAGSLTCEPAGAGETKVTWGGDFDMTTNPYRKLMGPVTKAIISKEFDRGLATIKATVEKRPVAAQ
jgi:hypothetical protein